VSRTWAGGSTRRWRKIRQRVLERDGHTCQLALPGCTRYATHAHHLHGKASGDDPAGLVAACPSCNLKTGDPTRRSSQPRPRRPRDPDPIPRTRW
jgi:5-methylcytosine-specific restriction endonuclease McrA